ncbi:hypothetical protein D3C87_2088580 [compost metagenome]
MRSQNAERRHVGRCSDDHAIARLDKYAASQVQPVFGAIDDQDIFRTADDAVPSDIVDDLLAQFLDAENI